MCHSSGPKINEWAWAIVARTELDYFKFRCCAKEINQVETFSAPIPANISCQAKTLRPKSTWRRIRPGRDEILSWGVSRFSPRALCAMPWHTHTHTHKRCCFACPFHFMSLSKYTHTHTHTCWQRATWQVCVHIKGHKKCIKCISRSPKSKHKILKLPACKVHST